MRKIYNHWLIIVIILSANLSMAQTYIKPIDDKYIGSRTIDSLGNEIIQIIVPGSPPPKNFLKSAVKMSSTSVIISDVPTFDWCFGCVPTSSAMMAGYYDRHGYVNLYTGPTNGGVCPLDNSVWGDTVINGETRSICPLSVTMKGIDGRLTRGHVDDYWIKTDNATSDPYIVNSWGEHSYSDCTGDFMKTSQSKYNNADGSTRYYYGAAGSKYTGTDTDDGPYGLQLFFESRGYTVTDRFTQTLAGYGGISNGYTFSDYKSEIDHNRPVLIHLEGHSVLGVGYDIDSTIYIHDTWDYSTHSMKWGKTYSSMQMAAVSVIHLEELTIAKNFVAVAASTRQINLSWQLNSNSNPVLVAWSTDGIFGTPVNGSSYSAGSTIAGGGTVLYYGSGTSVSHTQLTPATTYYYKIWSNVSGVWSDGVTSATTTDCEPFSKFPFTENFSTTSQPICWSQVDHQGNGQIWKFGTTIIPASPNSIVPNLTGNYAYINSYSYGYGNSQNADLISPVFDFTNYTNINITFNHYFFHYSTGSPIITLSYSTDNGATWNQMQQWTTSTYNPTVVSKDMTSNLAGYSQTILKWNYTGTWPSLWAIDDVTITATYVVPANATVSNKTMASSQTGCFDATQKITLAGDGSSVEFLSGSSVDLIAGQSIDFLPGFHAYSGSQLNASITTNGSYCSSLSIENNNGNSEKSSLLTIDNGVKADNVAKEILVKIYPNPSNGNFTVETGNLDGISELKIMNSLGMIVYHTTLLNDQQKRVDIPEIAKGIFIVQIINGKRSITRKITVN